MRIKKDINKKIFSHLMSIACIILFLVAATVYIYYPNKEQLLSSFAFLQTQEGFYIKEISSNSNLTAPYPVSDEEGMNNEAYQFKVVNNTNEEKHYQLIYKNQVDIIKKRELLPLETKYLRYSINEENNKEMEPTTLSEDEVVYEAVIAPNSESTFNFRIWLGENCDEGTLGKTYIGQMELKEIESSKF